MFLLNISPKSSTPFPVTFTIQNVPIKSKIEKFNYASYVKFTIQNVPIKFTRYNVYRWW